MQDGTPKRFFRRIQEVLVGPQYRVLFDDGECETGGTPRGVLVLKFGVRGSNLLKWCRH